MKNDANIVPRLQTSFLSFNDHLSHLKCSEIDNFDETNSYLGNKITIFYFGSNIDETKIAFLMSVMRLMSNFSWLFLELQFRKKSTSKVYVKESVKQDELDKKSLEY